MDIRVYVDQLILDGLPVDQSQGPRIQAAMEAELARLLIESPSALHLQAGIALPSVSAHEIQLAAGSSPTRMGMQIAQSVYSGIENI